MKLAIICNNPVALPSVKLLADMGGLCSVATVSSNAEMCAVLRSFPIDPGISVKIFEPAGFEQQLDNWLSDVQPDAVLMMTWPFRIPASALGKPKYGFINFHYGLLPAYAGANPVFEQIKRREQFGGITIHHADAGIDTGPVIMQQRIPISDGETFGSHMRSLSYVGAELSGRLFGTMAGGQPLPAYAQDRNAIKYYRKPSQQDVRINWSSMDAEGITALANACNPWNYGATTEINNWPLGLLTVNINNSEHGRLPGTILSINGEGLEIACINNKSVMIPVVYTQDGYIRGERLKHYGLKEGMCFS